MITDPVGRPISSAGDAVLKDAPAPHLADVVHMTDGQGCVAAIIAEVVQASAPHLAIVVALTAQGWIPSQRPIERIDHPELFTTPGPYNSWHPKEACPWRR